jgi:outer membrane lipoprotein-sorting protein
MQKLVATALVFAASAACAFSATIAEPDEAQIQDIIQKFAAKEAAFAQARENYTYRQTVKIHELDDTGAVTGSWEMVSDIVFDRDGKRSEHVVRAPVATLHNILLTPEDEQDLRSVQPFVLTTSEIPKYYIRYLGRQQVDEIGTYVFAVKPKKMEKGQRYFEGEIWVDNQDLQIVKSYGRGVGSLDRERNQFPKFETYREQIDGKYWFPTYTIANDTLNFKDFSQRIRMSVRYEDYKQFKTNINIQYGEPVKPDASKPDGAKPEQPPKP